jgi:membrane associated rhomboid family serine protease
VSGWTLWRATTSIFVHHDRWHLLQTMVFLIALGPSLLRAYQHDALSFVVFYALTSYAATTTSLWYVRAPQSNLAYCAATRHSYACAPARNIRHPFMSLCMCSRWRRIRSISVFATGANGSIVGIIVARELLRTLNAHRPVIATDINDWPASYILTFFALLDLLRCVWTQQSWDVAAYIGGGEAAYLLTVFRLLPLESATPGFPVGQSWLDELVTQFRQVEMEDVLRDLNLSNELVELVLVALVVSVLCAAAFSSCCGGTSKSETTSSAERINSNSMATALSTSGLISRAT